MTKAISRSRAVLTPHLHALAGFRRNLGTTEVRICPAIRIALRRVRLLGDGCSVGTWVSGSKVDLTAAVADDRFLLAYRKREGFEQMAGFRAIEQGVNLDRQTSDGLSEAFDYQGHILAAINHFRSSDYSMVADIPTRGVRTVYSRFGDWFAWLNVAAVPARIIIVIWTGYKETFRTPIKPLDWNLRQEVK